MKLLNDLFRIRQTAVRMVLLSALSFAIGVAAGCQPRDHHPDMESRVWNQLRAPQEHRQLVLPNRLKVMLISDPTADRSAASLSVAAGSLEDPARWPGLAHFLEHMLFLGTRKYPNAGEYQKFLSSHAGYGNAYTADDHTNYFFEVSHQGLAEGLDRFSQFFIAPLFSEKYASKEMAAVDSEHSKNRENDLWRIRQAQRNVLFPTHPLNRFSTGSIKTLKGVGQAELSSFFKSRYSANRMALTVMGNLSLDELEALVRKHFNAIVDHNLPDLSYPQDFLQPTPAIQVLSVQPLAETRSVTVEFPLPTVQREFEAKPLELIGFVLGHEGRGSLLSVLKSKNLATGLFAGEGENTASYSSFQVTVTLTPQGAEKWREVLVDLLGAVRGVEKMGIPPYLFRENQVMADLDNRYKPRESSAGQVSRLTPLMLFYPASALPDDFFLFTRYQPDTIRRLLARMVPQNMLVTLVWKGVATDATDPHYGTRYAYRKDPGLVQTLSSALPPEGFTLPEPNPFITHTPGLKPPQGSLRLGVTTWERLKEEGIPPDTMAKLAPLTERSFRGLNPLIHRVESRLGKAGSLPMVVKVVENAQPIPELIMDTRQGRVWFVPDWRFSQPKAVLVLRFVSPEVYRTPRHAMTAMLYEAALEESLNEFAYPVRMAGMSYEFVTGKRSVQLTLGGYSARILELLDRLSGRMTRIKLDEKQFESVKDQMKRSLANRKFTQPYQQLGQIRSLLLEEPSFSMESLEQELPSVQMADVEDFARKVLARTYLEGVVVGNISPASAARAIHRAVERLGGGFLPKAERVDRTIRQLPPKADWIYQKRLAVDNSLVNLIYQAGSANPRLRGALQLLAIPLGDRFYLQMRTQQQLGYIVNAGITQMKQELMFDFVIQSGQYPPGVQQARAEEFIRGFPQWFNRLSPAEFEKLRKTVILEKLEQESNLAQTAAKLDWMAFQNDEKFDYLDQEIAELKSLTQKQAADILVKVLETDRRRLVIQLVGRNHPSGGIKGAKIFAPGESRP